MRMTFAGLTAIVGLLIAPIQLSAKGDTIRITITGRDLAAPIEITDAALAASFNVWAGPGTSSNESQSLNVDWSQGAVDTPGALHIYEVSFVTTRGPYVVHYAIDPATSKGFVYVPGKTDAEYRSNTFLIYRGNEGKWFHALSEWEKLARPLIAQARVNR